MTDVWWDNRQQSTFTAAIQIEALDRTKLLRERDVGDLGPGHPHHLVHHAQLVVMGSPPLPSPSSWRTPATFSTLSRA